MLTLDFDRAFAARLRSAAERTYGPEHRGREYPMSLGRVRSSIKRELSWLVVKTMTYSIIGRDPLTGEVGIAVQSRFFEVGRIVPWIEAGVGAVVSQGFSDPIYGYRGLELLKQGATPQDALETIRRADAGAAMRQVAMLDVRGRVAVFTGQGCVAAAGHMIGDNCVAQANMIVRDTIWFAMVSAPQQSGGALADRLLAALAAAQKEGGDIRGTQAAALVVSSPKTTGHAALDRPAIYARA